MVKSLKLDSRQILLISSCLEMVYVSVLDFLQTSAKNADEMPLNATDKLG